MTRQLLVVVIFMEIAAALVTVRNRETWNAARVEAELRVPSSCNIAIRLARIQAKSFKLRLVIVGTEQSIVALVFVITILARFTFVTRFVCRARWVVFLFLGDRNGGSEGKEEELHTDVGSLIGLSRVEMLREKSREDA